MKSIYEKIEREPIKEYADYTLIQVYGFLNNEKILLYKTCKNRR